MYIGRNNVRNKLACTYIEKHPTVDQFAGQSTYMYV